MRTGEVSHARGVVGTGEVSHARGLWGQVR